LFFVVIRSFARIFENAERFVDLLEMVGVDITVVNVRMVPFGQFEVALLDFFVGCIVTDF